MRSHQLLFTIASVLAAAPTNALAEVEVEAEGAASTSATPTSLTEPEEEPELLTNPEVNVYEGPSECPTEEEIKSGDYVTVHYTAKIDSSSETGEKGKKFSSSYDSESGDPIDFQIGQGHVIKGWDIGLIGLCKGAKAALVIQPDLGYGSNGLEDLVPSGATLNFDVEILNVTDIPPPMPNLFAAIDKNGDGFIDEAEVKELFQHIGEEDDKLVPVEFWEENDDNGDKRISWEEFKGPKGDEDPTKKKDDDEDAPPEEDDDEEEAPPKNDEL